MLRFLLVLFGFCLAIAIAKATTPTLASRLKRLI